MPNIFLEAENKGANVKLRGNIAFCYLLIDTPDAAWSKSDIYETCKTIKSVSDFFTAEAAKRNVYLKIENVIQKTSLPYTIEYTTKTTQWENDILKKLKCTDATEMWKLYKSRFSVDDVAFCIISPSNGRSFASRCMAFQRAKYAVILERPKVGTIIHEICHLYGAHDYYYTKYIREKAKGYFGKSVMLCSRDVVIDSLTAYSIGWDRTPDQNAKLFLADTDHITEEDWSKARSENVFSGNGTFELTHGVYTGTLKDGFPEGFGKYAYDDGGCYEGQWLNGSRTGKGKYVYPNGSCYVGQWKNGKKHGQGTYNYSNGDRYKGQWKNGKRHGQGTYFYASGSCHEGRWENDKKA